ncbi:MAG: Ig-like domain-containing protein, partial [Betaproteobacteria bacterium]
MNRFKSYSKRPVWLMAFLLTAFVAGCGGGGGQDPILGAGGLAAGGAIPGAPAGAIVPGAACTAAAGPTIPTVTASDPTSGNQNVTISSVGAAGGGKRITATFSLAMNAATINATSFTLTPVGGAVLTPASVTYDVLSQVATLTTSAALLPNTSYTAVIAITVTSAAGSAQSQR